MFTKQQTQENDNILAYQNTAKAATNSVTSFLKELSEAELTKDVILKAIDTLGSIDSSTCKIILAEKKELREILENGVQDSFATVVKLKEIITENPDVVVEIKKAEDSLTNAFNNLAAKHQTQYKTYFDNQITTIKLAAEIITAGEKQNLTTLQQNLQPLLKHHPHHQKSPSRVKKFFSSLLHKTNHSDTPDKTHTQKNERKQS